MRKKLVTGGAGFLGSHLIHRLLRNGDSVVCLDNLSSSTIANIAHFIGHKNFDFIEQDIIQKIMLPVDQIYNLACPASPKQYQIDPIQTLKTCVIGAINVLELAQTCGARVLQASTSEVYGDPAIHPQKESYWGNVNPIGIRSCYDEGKRCAETLFFDYQRQHQVDIKVMRIFNTYGPKMHPQDGRVVSNFIAQAIRGEDITIYGTGLQTRSFCYVDDLIDGMQLLMQSNSDITGPMNFGNPVEHTMLELAETILSLVGSRSKLSFHPLPEDDPQLRQPSIEVAKKLLNWQPKVSLEDGLKETITYFKKTTYV